MFHICTVFIDCGQLGQLVADSGRDCFEVAWSVSTPCIELLVQFQVYCKILRYLQHSSSAPCQGMGTGQWSEFQLFLQLLFLTCCFRPCRWWLFGKLTNNLLHVLPSASMFQGKLRFHYRGRYQNSWFCQIHSGQSSLGEMPLLNQPTRQIDTWICWGGPRDTSVWCTRSTVSEWGKKRTLRDSSEACSNCLKIAQRNQKNQVKIRLL